MTRLSLIITLTSAVVLIGLGGFFWHDHGKSEYKRGFAHCQNVGAALATEAAEQLKDELQKFYTPTTVDRMLLDAGWMRGKDDK